MTGHGDLGHDHSPIKKPALPEVEFLVSQEMIVVAALILSWLPSNNPKAGPVRETEQNPGN